MVQSSLIVITLFGPQCSALYSCYDIPSLAAALFHLLSGGRYMAWGYLLLDCKSTFSLKVLSSYVVPWVHDVIRSALVTHFTIKFGHYLLQNRAGLHSMATVGMFYLKDRHPFPYPHFSSRPRSLPPPS